MVNKFIRKLPVGDRLIFFSGKVFNKIGSRILVYKNFKFWQAHYSKLEFKKVEVDFDGTLLHYKVDGLNAFARRAGSDSLVFDLVIMNEEYRPALDLFLLNNIPLKSFLDLGSNIGLVSVYVKKLFPEAEIIALEPDKNNYAMMLKNFAANGLSKITPLMAGVSKRDCFLLMDEGIRDKRDWAISFKEVEYPTEIESYSVTSLLSKYSLNEIDFIKMDVEGAEKEIFAVDADLSFLDKVKVMAIEIHDEFNTRSDIYQVLKEHGFFIFNSGETTIAVKRNLLQPAG